MGKSSREPSGKTPAILRRIIASILGVGSCGQNLRLESLKIRERHPQARVSGSCPGGNANFQPKGDVQDKCANGPLLRPSNLRGLGGESGIVARPSAPSDFIGTSRLGLYHDVAPIGTLFGRRFRTECRHPNPLSVRRLARPAWAEARPAFAFPSDIPAIHRGRCRFR